VKIDRLPKAERQSRRRRLADVLRRGICKHPSRQLASTLASARTNDRGGGSALVRRYLPEALAIQAVRGPLQLRTVIQRGVHASMPLPQVNVSLTSPARIGRALLLLGLEWNMVDDPTTERGAGLYAWVQPKPGIARQDSPCLYIGIGSDLSHRLTREKQMAKGNAFHAHGRTVRALNLEPVGGSVSLGPPDYSWMEVLGEPEWMERATVGLREAPQGAVEKAERIAIRFAVHDGYSPPPLNSGFATAWASDTWYDDAAWFAAHYLQGTKAKPSLPALDGPIEDPGTYSAPAQP